MHIDWFIIIRGLAHLLTSLPPGYYALMTFLIVVIVPMPGRGPGLLSSRDTWRGFKYEARRAVFSRAGGRCEAPGLLVWGRCPDEAKEADHIYPHSKHGPTILSNGQALCSHHNKKKHTLTPPWWYVWGLEHRRRTYFTADMDVRVSARMSNTERAARVSKPKPQRVATSGRGPTA